MIKKTLIGIALLIVTIIVGIAATYRYKQTQLIEGLVNEAQAIENRVTQRSVHRGEATPGTTAECLTPLLSNARVPDLKFLIVDKSKESAERISGVASMKAGLDSLQQTDIDQLTATLPWVTSLMNCTKMSSTANSLYINSFLTDDPRRTFQLSSLVAASRVSAWNIRVLSAEGKHEEALDACGDAFAFYRDLSLSNSLLNSMLAAAGTKRMSPSCVAAVNAAPMDVRERFARQLEVVQKSLPSNQLMMATERVGTGLFVGARYITAEQFTKLPQGLQDLSTVNSGALTFFFAPSFDEYLRTLESIADLPKAERLTATMEAKRKHKLPSIEIFESVSLSYDRYFDRLDQWKALLAVLQLGAQLKAPTEAPVTEWVKVTASSEGALHFEFTDPEMKDFAADFQKPPQG